MAGAGANAYAKIFDGTLGENVITTEDMALFAARCACVARRPGAGTVRRMNRESGSPNAARRRLAVRIAVLLQGWERHRRDPNRREAFHVMEALHCLRSGRYGEGEAAVARAELVRPIPDAAAGPGPHDQALTADLRAALQALS